MAFLLLVARGNKEFVIPYVETRSGHAPRQVNGSEARSHPRDAASNLESARKSSAETMSATKGSRRRAEGEFMVNRAFVLTVSAVGMCGGLATL